MWSRIKRIVFVCTENSNRSQMAQAFAVMHGGKNIEALSAGSKPSGRITPKAIEAMRERGYDLSTHSSKSLADIPGIEYDAVISMGCGDEGCPLIRARRHEDWQIPDPRDISPHEYRTIRDLIEQKVKALLRDIQE